MFVSNMEKSITVKFYGSIGGWKNSGHNFSNWFEELDRKYEHIIMRAHSYGGEVFEGSVIYNCILNAKAKTTIIVDGVAASMMAILLRAADEVIIARNGFIMIHAPSAGARGTAAVFESTAKLLRAIEANFIESLSGSSLQKQAEQWMDGNDYWFSAKEALKIGLVDKIVEPVVNNIKKLDKETAAKIGAKAAYNHFAAKLNKNNMEKGQIIDELNLQISADSTDADVLSAAKAKLTKAENRAKQAENALLEKETEEITAEVDAAINAGKVKPADKSIFLKIGENTGIQALKTVLANITNRQTILSQIDDGKKTQLKSWDDYQENDPRALESLMQMDFDAYSRLFEKKFNVKPVK